MSFTHKVGITYNAGDGQIAGTTETITGDSEIGFDGQIAAGAVNAEVDVAFNFTPLKACCLYSDLAVTVKTNSSSTPVDTIELAAKVPRIWKTSSLDANPFTANVTKLFISNPGAVPANVKIRALVDSTP